MKIERSFLHEDADHFRSCIAFTAKERDFAPELVEKDYFCSLVLERLCAVSNRLVFKGGTCLGKIYLDFFRLSEDLDFCIPLPEGSKRTVRRKAVEPFKKAAAELPDQLPGLAVVEPLTGRNESTQYMALISYGSLLGVRQNTIRIEIALREDLMTGAVAGMARTLLRDALTGEEAIPAFPVQSIAFQEALAEKTRAALTRLEPAIRDFFDIDFAVLNGKLNVQDPAFLGLVRKKLAVPGSGPVDMSSLKRRALESQVEAQLRPVLRDRDLRRFDLDRVFITVQQLAASIG